MKLDSIEDVVDSSLFQCVYSPAKRRGPIPGRAGLKSVGGRVNSHGDGRGGDDGDSGSGRLRKLEDISDNGNGDHLSNDGETSIRNNNNNIHGLNHQHLHSRKMQKIEQKRHHRHSLHHTINNNNNNIITTLIIMVIIIV